MFSPEFHPRRIAPLAGRAAALICFTLLGAPLAAQTGTRFNVVINEVASRSAVGGDRAVELYNYGAPVNLSGWILTYTSGASSNAFTLPSFALARHEFVTVRWVAGTNDAANIYTGAAVGFTLGSSSQLALKSSISAIGGEDYLCWGTCTGNPNLPAPITWNSAVSWASGTGTLARIRDLNSRDASDWVQTTLFTGTIGSLNGGQVGSRRHGRLVINEFRQQSIPADGAASWVELYNPHPFTVNSSGALLEAFDDGTTTPCISVALPASFTAGQLWSANLGGCVLRNNINGALDGEIRAGYGALSEGFDYVVFNQATTPNLPANLAWTGGPLNTVSGTNSTVSRRVGDLDSDNFREWATSIGAGSRDALNAGQQGAHRYDELGSEAANPGIGGGQGRGNQVDVTRSFFLREFKTRLETPASRTLYLAVFKKTSDSPETWTRIHQTALGLQSAADGVYTTGAAGLPIASPGSYIFMIFSDGDFNYYYSESGALERFAYGTVAGLRYLFDTVPPASTTVMGGVTATWTMAEYFLSDEGPYIMESSLPQGEEGVAYSQSFTSPTGSGALAWSGTGFPAGLSLNPVSGLLSGMPTVAGTFPITITATDANGASDTKSYSLVILPALNITTTAYSPAEVGVVFYQVLGSTGGSGGNNWTLISGVLPGGLGLSLDGAIFGTPVAAGAAAITIQVTDSLGATDTLAGTLTVYPPIAIVTAAVLPDGARNIAYSQTLQSSGGSLVQSWSVLVGALPAGLTLSGAGVLSGTPSGSGSFNFTVQVSDDAGGAASREFWLLIEAAFGIRNSALGVGYLNLPYSQTIVAGGGTLPYSFSITAGTLPAGINFNSTSGLLSGTPTTTGAFPLTFQATDGEARVANKALILTINPQPEVPAWRQRGLVGGAISAIGFSPNYATDGTVFVCGTALETYRHRAADLDPAGNWLWTVTAVDPGQLFAPVNDLVLSPSFDQNSTANEAAQTVFVVPGYGVGVSGIYKSTDHGDSYAPADSGLPAGRPSQVALSPNYANNGRMWLAFYDSATGLTLQRSNNFGATWFMQADLNLQLGLTDLIADDLAAGGVNHVFLSVNKNVYRSSDSGATWSGPIYTDPTYNLKIVLSPDFATDNTLLLISGFKVWRSRNRGESFTALTSSLNGAWSAAATRGPAGGVYWLFYKPGTGSWVKSSPDAGDTLITLGTAGSRLAAGSTASPIAAAPFANGRNDLLAASMKGVDFSMDGGGSWSAQDRGLTAIEFNHISRGGAGVMMATSTSGWFKSTDLGANWVFFDKPAGFILAPRLSAVSLSYDTDGTLFMADSADLFRSTDGGQEWTKVLDDLGIYAIAFQPGFSSLPASSKKKMWVAARSGLFYSLDAGQTFSTVTLPGACGVPGALWVRGLAVSPDFGSGSGDNTLFVGSPTLCKSTDGGAAWAAVSGVPFSAFVALAPGYSEVGSDRRMVAVSGNNPGVYSTNGGTSWNAISADYPYFNSAVISPSYAVDSTVYYVVNNASAGRASLYTSINGGATAQVLPSPPDNLGTRAIQGFVFGPFYSRLNGSSGAFAITQGSGIWRSVDSGASFNPATGYKSISNDPTAMANVAPDAAGAAPELPAGSILTGTTKLGVFKSLDGGATFTRFSKQLPFGVAIQALFVPSRAPGAPLAALLNNGLWRYNSGLGVWVKISSTGTGNFTDFAEDAVYLFATRRDGQSLRSADDGASWSTPPLPDQGDLVNVDEAGQIASVMGPTRSKQGPPAPAAIAAIASTTASLWAVSSANGPQYSTNSASTWVLAPGSNDYLLPSGQTWKVVKAMGLNAASGGREVAAGSGSGLFRTLDGGDTWRSVSGPGSGLEATSKDFSAILTSTTAYGTTDLLVGATGTLNGGVYLSGDGGEHWTQINSGFDPASLSISSLVKTSCSGCPVQYYSGSYGSGVYTRTVTVNAPPSFPSLSAACFGSTGCSCVSTAGSGPVAGGQSFKLCGANFQAGAAIEFDGVAVNSASCAYSSSTITCTSATPPHAAAVVAVRVRNPDTRQGILPNGYTYTGGASRAINLLVAKSGANAQLTWSCASCSAGNPARVYRSQNALFTLYPENYDGGTGGTYSNANAVSSAQSYFWSVE